MDTPSSAIPIDELESNFETVVIAGPDMQGRLLGRRLPVGQFVAQLGVDICSAALAWDIAQSAEVQVPLAGYHTGWHDWRLAADLGTLRRAAWLEGTAFCMADYVDGTTHAPVAVAPRSILRGQVNALAAQGLSAVVATELEFYLYTTSYGAARRACYRGLDPTNPARSDYSILASDTYESFFFGLREKALASGVHVGASQAEWGRGQWEMNLVHTDPIAAADEHSLLKLIAREHAAAHSMAATFMARPHADDVGSSSHIHLSLRSADGSGRFHDPAAPLGMSGMMLSALGGVLERLDDAMVWFAPTINSYRRTNAAEFAGRGRTWGVDNRTVSVRVAGRDAQSLRFEVRVPGADANPYLAVAAVLAAALDGIERGADPGEQVVGNAYSAEVDPLPRTLREAVAAFSASSWARNAFSDLVVDHYASVLTHECDAFETTVTDWELERYFGDI